MIIDIWILFFGLVPSLCSILRVFSFLRQKWFADCVRGAIFFSSSSSPLFPNFCHYPNSTLAYWFFQYWPSFPDDLAHENITAQPHLSVTRKFSVSLAQNFSLFDVAYLCIRRIEKEFLTLLTCIEFLEKFSLGSTKIVIYGVSTPLNVSEKSILLSLDYSRLRLNISYY